MNGDRLNKWIVKNYPKFRKKSAMVGLIKEKFGIELSVNAVRLRYFKHGPKDDKATIERYIRSRTALPNAKNARSFKSPSSLYPAFPYVAKIRVPRMEESLHILENATRSGEIRMISRQDYLKAEQKHDLNA